MNKEIQHQHLKAILALVPMLAQMILIFYFSSSPLPKSMSSVPDYLLHFTCYAVLCFFVYTALKPHFVSANFALLLLSFTISTVYGFLDEYHQSFVPGRTASWKDAISDALGAFTVILAIRIFRKDTPGLMKSS